MEQSLFVQFAAFFKAIAKDLVERVNGKKTPLTYLHKEMLTKELSTDLKWQTLNVDGSVVSADVVAMDSALPLKKRDSFGTASGDIPKLGMKLSLNEKTMSDIDVLQARNVETKILVGKIFADTTKSLLGIYEKLEFMFLQGLSTGLTLVDDDTNVGSGIRVNYGYPAANKFGAVKPWSDSTSKPIDDIKRIIKQAKSKGNVLSVLMMDEATFDNLAMNQQTREQYAFSQNFVGSQIPVPDIDQVNTMLQKRYKLSIIIVDRTVVTERDGVRTIQTPWAANTVVFLQNTKVGKLVYGILAEETRPNKSVMYEKADGFILLKKWHQSEPFAEFTSSQALALPVISNVDSIYLLDTEEAAVDAQTEGDANFDYEGTSYTKQSVVDALKLAKPTSKLTIASTDAKLLDAINALSEEQILVFEANIVEAV
ncbi:MAG: major capsid protein [Bacteroidetes bacterium]|nr:major capsid protein [Bacteroidota bacterium]